MTEPAVTRPPQSEVMPVPAEEALNFATLEPWLREHLGATGPIEAARFTVGHANLTYLLRIGGEEYVLRRPPLGPIPPARTTWPASTACFRCCTRPIPWRRAACSCAPTRASSARPS